MNEANYSQTAFHKTTLSTPLLTQESPPDSENTPLYHGHRQRLKERFLKNKRGSLADYELIELLLFSAHLRRDVKPLAKTLLSTFGSIGHLLNAPTENLRRIEGVNDSVIVLLRAIVECAERTLREELQNRPIFSDITALLNYCRISHSFSAKEELRVLYLNRNNELLADDLTDHGTIDQIAIYPREILKRALSIDASAIILIHNHPSGNTQPSHEDITLTRAIHQALATVEIRLHDHVIIAPNSYFSFRKEGLI